MPNLPEIGDNAAAVSAIGGAIALVIGWVKGAHKAVWSWAKRKWSGWRERRKWRRDMPRLVQEIASKDVRDTKQFTALSLRLHEMGDVLLSVQEAMGSVQALSLAQFHRSRVPMFLCDNRGFNLDVNAAYVTLTGLSRDALMGYGYRSYLDAEGGAYIAGFERAAIEHRVFQGDMGLRNGRRFNVHMVPHPPDRSPATHWVGSVEQIL